MYVDNAVDLVGLDLSDHSNIKEISRIEKVIPEPRTPDGLNVFYDYPVDSALVKDKIIIRWEKVY